MQSLGFEDQEAVDYPASSDVAYQTWVGKDYYNPFVKDFVDLHKPHDGNPYSSYHFCMWWYKSNMMAMAWNSRGINSKLCILSLISQQSFTITTDWVVTKKNKVCCGLYESCLHYNIIIELKSTISVQFR